MWKGEFTTNTIKKNIKKKKKMKGKKRKKERRRRSRRRKRRSRRRRSRRSRRRRRRRRGREEEERKKERTKKRKEGRKRSIPFAFVRPCCISLHPLEQIQTNVSTMQKLFCSCVLVRKISSVISLQFDRDAGENIGRICEKSMLTLLIIKGSRKLLKQ